MFNSIRLVAKAVARNHIGAQVGSRAATSWTTWGLRMYSAETSKITLTEKEATERVMKVMKAYDGVEMEKVTPKAHFIKDLGLDSLDTVELVILIEEEFGVTIPDTDAEKIFTVQSAVDYIMANPKK